MKRNLLYVDDQRDNLVVFRVAFNKSFNILEAQSAVEALELFEAHEIPLMVADQRMPDMTGVELCEIVAREHPYTIRMILTGHADSDAMMNAINKGHVYNFATKPWERETMLPILLRGLEAHDLAISNSSLLERLDHTDRCATLGQLAAGMAHEMRNQLFVLPLVEMLEQKCADDQELMQLAQIARSTHERLKDLINEVMSFVRKEDETYSMMPVNLAGMARETLSLAGLDGTIPKHTLELEVRAEPIVKCHKAKFEQVVFNLVKNAADAVRNLEDRKITVIVDRSGEGATLSVRDNGPGIDPGILERIWEPFFSTKGADGNGLGLDLCRRIVEAHGGAITYQSSTDGGAEFTIVLSELPKHEDR